MASNVVAMASNLVAKAHKQVALASNLVAMASNGLQRNNDGLQPSSSGSDSLQPKSEGLQPPSDAMVSNLVAMAFQKHVGYATQALEGLRSLPSKFPLVGALSGSCCIQTMPCPSCRARPKAVKCSCRCLCPNLE